MGLVQWVEKKYGRKKGLVRHITALAQYNTGKLKQFDDIDFSRVKRIIYVCKGNICRSAFAEFKTLSIGFKAASGGLAVVNRDPADQMASQVAQERGIDLSDHFSKNIRSLDVDESDLLVTFEPWQAESVAAIVEGSHAQVTLLGLHSKVKRPHLEDPYSLSKEYFQTCFSVIEQGVMGMVDKTTMG